VANGTATSADGTRIAWYRYGGGERTIVFVPTWNLVDARVVGHEVELDWTEPARLLGSAATPTLVIHGADDEPVPVELADSIVVAMQSARLEVIAGGGHRPDIRSPVPVNPLLLGFLLGRRAAEEPGFRAGEGSTFGGFLSPGDDPELVSFPNGTTRPPRWATTSRSTSTARDCATSSRWSATAPRAGMGPNRFVPPPPESVLCVVTRRAARHDSLKPSARDCRAGQARHVAA
jgi:hypothetical protein